MAEAEALSNTTTETNIQMQISNNEQKLDEKDINEYFNNEDIIFRKDGETIDVGLYTYVYRIDNINLVDQSFDALFYLTLSWKPTKKEWELYQSDPLGYVPLWIPSIHIPNGANIIKKVVKGDKNSGYRIAKTGLNLHEHPFGRKIGKFNTQSSC